MVDASIFPPHKAGLYLTHNAHKDGYQTVRQWWDEYIGAVGQYDESDWVSPEQFAKAMEANEVWTLHWYPDTPVGFHKIFAADFDALLKRAHEIAND